MNTLLWLCQNATNWISNPEVQQGDEENHLFVTSAIAIGAIATVGVLYSLANRNSSLHIPEGLEHREVIARAFRQLPEMLQTQENLATLIASGANAGLVAGGINILTQRLLTRETRNALIASGVHAIWVAITIHNSPENLLTQENYNAYAAIGENAEAFRFLLETLPENLLTQENRDLLSANGGEKAELIADATSRLIQNLRTPENLNAFFRNTDSDRLEEIRQELTAIHMRRQAITQEHFDEIVRIADENANFPYVKGAVED